MSHCNLTVEERFVGCLLGLAVGDAFGSQFEGQSPDFIARRYRTAAELIDTPPPGELWYTDDTQMAIGIAETLIACGRIDTNMLCTRFAANYVPQRGYGRGARIILQAICDGEDHQYWAETTFPGGSLGNGAAMRVAPIGLLFRDDHDAVWEQARLSSLPTHIHPLGIEGAQIVALAVALASSSDVLDPSTFFEKLASRCEHFEYSGPLRRAARLDQVGDLALFGNGIEATASVVTAIASFGLTPHSYSETVGNAILLGGDTDTIAAMAGAISGAYLGVQAIPDRILANLEDRKQGKTYIKQLAKDVYERYLLTAFQSSGAGEVSLLWNAVNTQAERCKTMIDKLFLAKETDGTLDAEVTEWLSRCDDTLHDKLLKLGLVVPRKPLDELLVEELLSLLSRTNEERFDMAPV